MHYTQKVSSCVIRFKYVITLLCYMTPLLPASLFIPRYPAVDPHTVGPQRPLEQRRVGCRTTWPVAPRAGRSSRIQSLQKVKHNFTYGAVCKTGEPETEELRGATGSMRENVQNKGVLWPRVCECLCGVRRFCIMHYVIHIFVH